MAERHPAFPGTGPVYKAIEQLRKSFPAELNAGVLKKLSIANGNESRLLNVFHFIGVLDEEGRKTQEAAQVFSIRDNPEFQKAFGEILKKAYTELFALYQDAAWELDRNQLVNYFRQADQTSEVTGQRQALTFQTLASIAGHGESSSTPSSDTTKRSSKGSSNNNRSQKIQEKPSDPSPAQTASASESKRQNDVNLTVRIEVNLPAGGDQETYDRIFKSIREHLIDGN